MGRSAEFEVSGGSWVSGHLGFQFQVWEKITKISTHYSLASFVYHRVKESSKETLKGVCRFSWEKNHMKAGAYSYSCDISEGENEY